MMIIFLFTFLMYICQCSRDRVYTNHAACPALEQVLQPLKWDYKAVKFFQRFLLEFAPGQIESAYFSSDY